MKIAAERDKDTLDIARLLHRLNITNANHAVDLAYTKYGDHSIPLNAGRDNYLIVVDDALDAATTPRTRIRRIDETDNGSPR
jgi:hypothetical protein